jgi:hypothetical protein
VDQVTSIVKAQQCLIKKLGARTPEALALHYKRHSEPNQSSKFWVFESETFRYTVDDRGEITEARLQDQSLQY